MPSSRQLPLPFAPAPPPSTPPPFFASASNRAALAWLAAPDTWPERRLLLWGEAGIGKTHLLQGWAAAEAATFHAGVSLRWPLAGAASGSIAIDDAELAPEETLLHVLNEAAAAGRPVLLAARVAPSGWATGLPDLASRLRATTAVRMDPAEDSLLGAILRRLCAERQLTAPEPVQAFLLKHLPRNAAALREAAARLDHASLASGGRVTRALAVAIVDEMAAMWHAEAS